MVAQTLALSSCGHAPLLPVSIPEMNFYTLEGAQGVHVTHFFSATTSDMATSAWDQISEGKVCMEPAGIAGFKGALQKACSELTCNEQDLKTAMAALDRLIAKRK